MTYMSNKAMATYKLKFCFPLLHKQKVLQGGVTSLGLIGASVVHSLPQLGEEHHGAPLGAGPVKTVTNDALAFSVQCV